MPLQGELAGVTMFPVLQGKVAACKAEETLKNGGASRYDRLRGRAECGSRSSEARILYGTWCCREINAAAGAKHQSANEGCFCTDSFIGGQMAASIYISAAPSNEESKGAKKSIC